MRGGHGTMPKKGLPRVIAMAFVLVFMFCAAGFAYESGEDQMVIPDLLFGRPVGLLALGVGGVTFAVTIPVTLPFGWMGKALDVLVKKPYRFTFQRGLGEDLDKF